MGSVADKTVQLKKTPPESLTQWQSLLLKKVSPSAPTNKTQSSENKNPEAAQHPHTSISSRSQSLTISEKDPARIIAYRTNAKFALINTIKQTYPEIAKLVGTNTFQHLAIQYIQTHALQSLNLHDYGQEFHLFLATHELSTDYPYLADLAKLEWAIQTSYYASNSTHIDDTTWQELLNLEESQQSLIQFSLQANIQLVTSYFALDNIGTNIRFHYHPDIKMKQTSVSPMSDNKKSFYVVARNMLAIEVHKLPASDIDAFREIEAGVDLATMIHSGNKVQAFLYAIQNQWLCCIQNEAGSTQTHASQEYYLD